MEVLHESPDEVRDVAPVLHHHHSADSMEPAEASHSSTSASNGSPTAVIDADTIRDLLKNSSLSEDKTSLTVQEIAQIAASAHRTDNSTAVNGSAAAAITPLSTPQRHSYAAGGAPRLGVRRSNSRTLPGMRGVPGRTSSFSRPNTLQRHNSTGVTGMAGSLQGIAPGRTSSAMSGSSPAGAAAAGGMRRAPPRRTTSTDSALRAYRTKDGAVRRMNSGAAGDGGSGNPLAAMALARKDNQVMRSSSLRARGGSTGMNTSAVEVSRGILRGRSASEHDSKSVMTGSGDMDSVFSMDSISLRKTQLVADPLGEGSYHEDQSYACHETVCTNLSRDEYDEDDYYAPYVEYLPEGYDCNADDDIGDCASVLTFGTYDTLGFGPDDSCEEYESPVAGPRPSGIRFDQSCSTGASHDLTDGDEFFDDIYDQIYDIEESGKEDDIIEEASTEFSAGGGGSTSRSKGKGALKEEEADTVD